MRRLVLVLALAQMGLVMAAQGGAKELRLGYSANLTHGQALYARVTGEFEREIEVPIRWTAFSAGPTAMEALFANAVDATFIGPSPTINGYVKSRGEKLVIVAGSASGGAGLVVRKDSGIRSEKDFGGKTIATPQFGNTQDVAARAWLAERGYRLRERGGSVSLVPLSNPGQLNLFRKKQIDGAWTVEPWLSRIEMAGGGRVLLEEKSLWPGDRYVTTHLVVNRTFLADNQDLMRKLIAALVEVTQRINLDKTAAAVLLNRQIEKETGKALRDEVMQKAMGRVEFTWDPICSSLKQSAEASHRIGFIRKEPVLDGIYKLALLQEVLKEKRLPAVEGPAP